MPQNIGIDGYLTLTFVIDQQFGADRNEIIRLSTSVPNIYRNDGYKLVF